MPINENSPKGYGGIETYCLVEGSSDSDGCIAVIKGLSPEDIQRIKKKFENLQNRQDLSGESGKMAPSEAVFVRARNLSRLLSR